LVRTVVHASTLTRTGTEISLFLEEVWGTSPVVSPGSQSSGEEIAASLNLRSRVEKPKVWRTTRVQKSQKQTKEWIRGFESESFEDSIRRDSGFGNVTLLPRAASGCRQPLPQQKPASLMTCPQGRTIGIAALIYS
jgi:hypothetical protein